jgi:hypothetical protein
METLKVINRKGVSEDISFDQINNRIKKLADFTKSNLINESLTHVNSSRITVETIAKLYDNITTRQLDNESAKVCSTLESVHYNYGLLGGRILASDHHKHLKTLDLNSFSIRTKFINSKLPNYYNSDYVKFIIDNLEILDNLIDLDRDYTLNYFAFRTLERSYLIKINNEIIETPQDMFMRVAINIHYRSDINFEDKINLIKTTYNSTSLGYYTHATPTLFNAGTKYEQMSSCYLLGTDDSLQSIFKTISESPT